MAGDRLYTEQKRRERVCAKSEMNEIRSSLGINVPTVSFGQLEKPLKGKLHLKKRKSDHRLLTLMSLMFILWSRLLGMTQQ